MEHKFKNNTSINEDTNETKIEKLLIDRGQINKYNERNKI